MLKAHEELWEMELSENIEKLLAKYNDTKGKRDKTRIVSF